MTDEGDVSTQLSQCLNDLEQLDKKEMKVKIRKEMEEKKRIKQDPDQPRQEESLDLLAPEQDQEAVDETQLDQSAGPSWVLSDKSRILNETEPGESFYLDNSLIRMDGPKMKKYTLHDLHQQSDDVMRKRKGNQDDESIVDGKRQKHLDEEPEKESNGEQTEEQISVKKYILIVLRIRLFNKFYYRMPISLNRMKVIRPGIPLWKELRMNRF